MNAKAKQENPMEDSFSSYVQRLMEQHEPPLGIKAFAAGVDISYEHARKLFNGITLPSKLLIPVIARFFQVDEEEMAAVVKADKFRREYGDTFTAPIFNHEAASFASAWPELTEDGKKHLLRELKKAIAKYKKTK